MGWSSAHGESNVGEQVMLQTKELAYWHVMERVSIRSHRYISEDVSMNHSGYHTLCV